MTAQKCVLVTGIGGNVAQGVLRILAEIEPDLRIVGTNTFLASGGNHLCDTVHVVPPAVDPAFRSALLSIAERERPDLLIPCTDAETLALSLLSDVLPGIAVSPPDVCSTFIDKHLTAQAFSRAGLPFARSALPSAYGGSFGRVIVKPREGRGSRGLVFDPPRPWEFDDTHVVQELLEGDEVTIGFYVTRARSLHGFLVMRRMLQDGTTIACEVTRRHDDAVSALLERLVSALEIRGSCNLQAIVTVDGRIMPFEVNGRFSGTTSIRHHFGLRDVEYTLDEHLWERDPKPVVLSQGSAHRLLMDVIYPGLGLDEPKNKRNRHWIF